MRFQKRFLDIPIHRFQSHPMNLGHLAAQINALATRYHPLTPTSIRSVRLNPFQEVVLEDEDNDDLRDEIKERDGEIKDREKEIETLEKQVTELEEELNKANDELASVKIGEDSARYLLDRVKIAENETKMMRETCIAWKHEVECVNLELQLLRKRKGRVSEIIKHGDAVTKIIFHIAEGKNTPETLELAKKLAEISKTA